MTSADEAQAAIRDYVGQPFGTFAELFRLQARARPDQPALICGDAVVSYGELDILADRIAAGLQRGGVARGQVAAVCSTMSIAYVAVLIGALRSAAAVALLSPSATIPQLQAMLEDSGAAVLFLDAAGAAAMGPGGLAPRVAIGEGLDALPLEAWLPAQGARAEPSRWRSRRRIRSTSSTPPAPPARLKASCSRTPCAGRNSTWPTPRAMGRTRWR